MSKKSKRDVKHMEKKLGDLSDQMLDQLPDGARRGAERVGEQVRRSPWVVPAAGAAAVGAAALAVKVRRSHK